MPTRIHSLDTVAPAAPIESLRAFSLRVNAVHLPPGLDRIEIVTGGAPGVLQINDLDHWSAPLSQVARQVLSLDLAERLPPGTVIYPRLPRTSAELGVDIDVLDFAIAGSQATMSAGWAITSGAAAQAPKLSAATLHSTAAAADPSGVARAWSVLMGQLADQIAADAAALQRAETP